MDYDAYGGDYEINERWFYERGRLFGMLYNGPLKYGRSLNNDAVWAFNDALWMNLIT